MLNCLKKTTVLFLGLAIVTLLHPLLNAYVIQGPHILELMTAKLGQAESLSVSQKVIFYKIQPLAGPSGLEADDKLKQGDETYVNSRVTETVENSGDVSQPEAVELNESLSYIFSEAFRSDTLVDESRRIHVFADGQTLTVVDGMVAGTAETRFDLYKDLLLYRSRELLSERLSFLGVDVSVASLGRFEGQIAFVVGAEYPDESVPQVWIDKETFQPLRWIITSGGGTYSSDFLEVRYLEWQKIGEIWYPMRIEFVQDDSIVRIIEVEEFEVNPGFSKDIFDIARLKSEYRSSSSKPARANENEGLSEVQKTIEEFRKIFE